jgi:hemerythrin-like domain-containing protein
MKNMNYYDMGIKDVIGLYPKIGELLLAYEVDCAACAVGTCLMKDVLDIHNFSPEEKQTITAQMDKIIDHQDVDIAAIRPVRKTVKTAHSKPIQKLVDEHKNILRLLDLAQYVIDKKELTPSLTELLTEAIFYVRNYADKHHHAKEENILFIKTDGNQEIIKSMFAEHEMGRGYIVQATAAIASNNHEQIRQSIQSYIDMLREHIRKEDSILYPWFDRNMSNEEKDALEQEFAAANRRLDANLESDLLKFLDNHDA